jgi:hypothetical protein
MIEHNSAVSSVLDSSEGLTAIVLADTGALTIEGGKLAGSGGQYLFLLQKDGADAGNKRYVASSSDHLELESYRLKLLQLRKTYTPPKKGK